MAGLSYVIGKLAFEEAFIIISLILFKIYNYFAKITSLPSMSPFVGTPTTPLYFVKKSKVTPIRIFVNTKFWFPFILLCLI